MLTQLKLSLYAAPDVLHVIKNNREKDREWKGMLVKGKKLRGHRRRDQDNCVNPQRCSTEQNLMLGILTHAQVHISAQGLYVSMSLALPWAQA